MNASDLIPVGQLAERTGAKILLYGPPGTGKTPMAMSLPNSVACITEPGTRSVRGYSTPCAKCYDYKSVVEFFKWFCDPNSKDVYQFQNLIIDNLTKLADIVLEFEKTRNKDPRKAYGNLLDYVLGVVNYLQTMANMNVIFITQMQTLEVVVPGGLPIPGQIQTKPYNRPLFPGQKLDEKVPHAIDEVLYVHRRHRPDGIFGTCILTKDNGEAMARSRTPDRLAELEPPDLAYIINKLNS